MRVVLTSMLLAIGFGLIGCQSTPKSAPSRGSSTGSPTNNINNGERPFWSQPENRRGPTLNTPRTGATSADGMKLTSAEQPDPNGVLAGKLVDSAGRQPKRVYIQVQPADGGSGRPIEVSAGDDGYFMIPGLTPGRGYMLTARAEDGGKLLAGRVQAIPPNPRLLIRLSEDQAGSDVPALPPSPGAMLPGAPFPGPRASNPAPTAPPLPELRSNMNRPEGDWSPASTGAIASPFPLSSGSADDSAPPLPPPPAGPAPNIENIADRQRDREIRPAPRVNIPGPGSVPDLPEPDPVPGTGGGPSTRRSAPSSPASCEMAGNRVVGFVLPDLDGRPWDFRQRHGRLVLLDFWGTWCPHCIKAMPQLRDLQRRYGAAGLEVIGIACEDGGGSEVVRQVHAVSVNKNLNYQVLVAENFRRSPLVEKFQVKSYPTMILLDESGLILARAEGGQLPQIEAIIQQRLGRR